MKWSDEESKILWKAADILAKRRIADKVSVPISSNNGCGLLSFEQRRIEALDDAEKKGAFD